MTNKIFSMLNTIGLCVLLFGVGIVVKEKVTLQLHINERLTQQEEMLAPTVRLTVREEGQQVHGTGILLYCTYDKVTSSYFSYILTCAHVVDSPIVRGRPAVEVLVEYWNNEGHNQGYATIKEHDSSLDLALLSLATDAPLPVVKLLPDNRPVFVFDDIYVIGCLLGDAPFVQKGQISGLNFKEIVINTATMGGSSGGPVFLAETNELVGMIFGIRYIRKYNKVVEHIGLGSTINVIHEWLRQSGYGFFWKSNEE